MPSKSETLLFERLNGFANKNRFTRTATIFFSVYFHYFLVAFLLFLVIQNKQFLPMLLLSVFLGRVVITEIVRYFVRRPRPFVNHQVNLLIKPPKSFSFPSADASFLFSLVPAVYLHNPVFGIFFSLSSVLVSLARVAVGVHWPADIFAGALIGIFSGIITNFGIALFHF